MKMKPKILGTLNNINIFMTLKSNPLTNFVEEVTKI